LRGKKIDTMSNRFKLISWEHLGEPSCHAQDAFDMLAQSEQQELLFKAMEVLSDREKMFIKFHLIKGLSVGDAGRAIGVTANNAATIKHRILKKLRQEVEKVSNPKTDFLRGNHSQNTEREWP
jgi:RNA polymerase sigma factor (sigma-70 family)